VTYETVASTYADEVDDQTTTVTVTVSVVYQTETLVGTVIVTVAISVTYVLWVDDHTETDVAMVISVPMTATETA